MDSIYLNIAEIDLTVKVPSAYGTFTIPRSWNPFLRDSLPHPAEVVATLSPEPAPESAEMKEIASSTNDLGAVRLLTDGVEFIVMLSAYQGGHESAMELASDFRSATMYIPADDPNLSFLVDSMLRILMSQAFITLGGFMLHSSAIAVEGDGAYLFMGKSGTGKSTHTRLWRESFSDVHLLNDDIPVVRLMPDGTPRAYGSPWSGKTPCWRDESAPLRALVRLEQAAENRYRDLEGVDALLAVLPGVSVISACRRLYDEVCGTLLAVIPQVKVGMLSCRADAYAALLSRKKCAAAPTH